jgi:hypothetical protein
MLHSPFAREDKFAVARFGDRFPEQLCRLAAQRDEMSIAVLALTVCGQAQRDR